MKAFKIQVQVHCAPREFGGNKYDSMWRCQRQWPVGTTKADLVVVRRADLPKVSDDQRPAQLDALHKQGAVTELEFQGLVDDVSLATLVLKRERCDFEFKTVQELEPKKLIVDEWDEEDATRPAQQAQQPKR
jgi:hypothetical protein